MSGLLLLIPVAIGLGLLALAAFLWALRSGQYDDLEGAGHRILDDEPPAPDPEAKERAARFDADQRRAPPPR